MALTEQTKEYVEILPNGGVQIKTVTEIYRDGELIATQNHRSSHEPGEDMSTKSDRVKSIASTIWKPEVIKAHQDAKAEAARKSPVSIGKLES